MQARQRFMAYRRGTCRPTTCQRTDYALARWETFLAGRGLTAEQADDAAVADYVATWRWSPLTKAQHISVLRTFYAWMVRQGLVARNPWQDIRGPRKPVRVPRVLSRVELQAIEGALAEPTTRDLRDRALILFLTHTGCRIGEVLGLDLADLHLPAREAIVLGKGDRERVVLFGAEAAEALGLWIRVGRPRWAKSSTGPVFVGRHGERLCYAIARYALIRAARDAHLGRSINPHLLRHTFATTAIERNLDLPTLQVLLGHSRLDTTQTYLHVARGRMRSRYDEVFGRGEAFRG